MQSILKNGLRFIGLASLFFVTLEVTARLDDWLTHGASPFVEYSASSMLLDRDSLGIKGKAHGKFEKWSLNSLGFRAPEFQIQKPQGLIRIVTLGASETFGLYESEFQEWPNKLKDYVQQKWPGRAIEVINASIVGLTISSLEPYYNHRIAAISPDLVLIYPHFIDYIAGDGPHAPAASSHRPLPNKSNKASKKFTLGSLRIAGKIKTALKTKGPAPIIQWYTRLSSKRNLASIEFSSQKAGYDTLELARFDSLFSAFTQSLKQQNVELVISEYSCSFMKGSHQETLEGMENLWRLYPWMSRQALESGLKDFNLHLGEIAHRNGAIFVSQTNLLDQYQENWVADGIHFTNLGAERAAQNFYPVVDAWIRKKFPEPNSDSLPRGQK